MELELIERHSQYWILLLFLSNVLVLAIIRYVSNLPVSVTLNHFLQIKKNDHTQDPIHPLVRILLLINFTLLLALAIAMMIAVKQENAIIEFKDYLMILVVTSSFLLLKRYLNLFIASLLDFLGIMQLMEWHRDNARILTGIPLLLLGLLWIVTSGIHDIQWMITFSVLLVILPLLIIRLVLNLKDLLLSSVFYFIVYLCALEIAPYLLLYKYFIG